MASGRDGSSFWLALQVSQSSHLIRVNANANEFALARRRRSSLFPCYHRLTFHRKLCYHNLIGPPRCW
jgi:hypothetical protein